MLSELQPILIAAAVFIPAVALAQFFDTRSIRRKLQAMLEALQESGRGGGETVLHVYLNGRKMAVEVVKEINNMTRETGKPVLVL